MFFLKNNLCGDVAQAGQSDIMFESLLFFSLSIKIRDIHRQLAR